MYVRDSSKAKLKTNNNLKYDSENNKDMYSANGINNNELTQSQLLQSKIKYFFLV